MVNKDINELIPRQDPIRGIGKCPICGCGSMEEIVEFSGDLVHKHNVIGYRCTSCGFTKRVIAADPKAAEKVPSNSEFDPCFLLTVTSKTADTEITAQEEFSLRDGTYSLDDMPFPINQLRSITVKDFYAYIEGVDEPVDLFDISKTVQFSVGDKELFVWAVSYPHLTKGSE